MGQVLLDSLLDALKLLPFLFLLYILIELMEHKTAMGKPGGVLTGKLAPLAGSAAGLVPMCGFSVMAGKLYERRLLTVGTLFSVFVATSDEALLVLALSGLPAPEKVFVILALIGCKFVLAAGVGYLFDFIWKKATGSALSKTAFEEHGHEHGEEAHGHGEEEPSVCEHRHASPFTLYFLSPLWHALKVALVVFLFGVLFGALFKLVGEERVLGFLQGTGKWFQPAVTALVGSIPNCASSVVLAECYSIGGIGFGSLLGGLVTNAGFGAFILFRNAKAWKRNLLFLLLTILLGVLFGYAASAVEWLIL